MATVIATPFQQAALLLTGLWLVVVVLRFRRSIIVLLVGLLAIALFTLVAFAYGKVTPGELGLGIPNSWLPTLGFALSGLAVTLACSPLADWLARRVFEKPPTLEAYHGLQQSSGKLIAGIVSAWVLGGILEELVARGIVLRSIEALLAAWLTAPVAAALAVCTAALGAGLIHSYQGPRAMLIIAQLSLLFGVLFVISGYNLWAVMACHGLYDTIAFVRFAGMRSKYSHLDQDQALSSETRSSRM